LCLEKYYPQKDFVVLVFEAMFKDTFAACYVKHLEGCTIWSKAISNDWFEDNCGADYKDWSATAEFNIKGVYGRL
jgi:hypothetical protein